MRFTAWYAILVGILMTGQWSFFLASGSVPEVQSEPIRLAFHLAAEFLTAISLIVAGWAALRAKRWSRTFMLAALGMLVYTVVISPGYFAQQGQWPLVGMFAILLVLTLVSIHRLSKTGNP
jgi:hypothetical protein